VIGERGRVQELGRELCGDRNVTFRPSCASNRRQVISRSASVVLAGDIGGATARVIGIVLVGTRG